MSGILQKIYYNWPYNLLHPKEITSLPGASDVIAYKT